MNCKPGELAFVIRSRSAWNPIGRIVRVNHWAVIEGVGQWDVESLDGSFLFLHDDDLCAMRGWDLTPGCRDELFDPVWIYGDYMDGLCRLNQIGAPKYRTLPKGAR